MQATRQSPSRTLTLKLAESAISPEEDGTLSLVNLVDYWNFLTHDVEGTTILRQELFESNVRAFGGDTDVNSAIRRSLDGPTAPFWWLNNGITIIAQDTKQLTGKTIELTNPQVVNGLQTSTVVHQYMLAHKDEPGNQRVIVRIVKTADSQIRDAIIRATNHQTRVTDAMLRATDDFQRDIQDYFKQQDWYYERRNNEFRDASKPRDRIVSITSLAQAVMAYVLSRPHDARGRPTSILKSDDEYKALFQRERPLPVYLYCIRLSRIVDKAIRQSGADLRQDAHNVRFHIGLLLLCELLWGTGGHRFTLSDLAKSNITPTAEQVTRVAQRVVEAARQYGRDQNWQMDRVAKSSEFGVKMFEVVAGGA